MVFQASPVCGKENNMKLLTAVPAGLVVHKKSITVVCASVAMDSTTHPAG